MTDNTTPLAIPDSFSIYPDQQNYIRELAAELYEHNESRALRAIIDDHRTRWQTAAQPAEQAA